VVASRKDGVMDVLPLDVITLVVSFISDQHRPRALNRRWMRGCWRARRSLSLCWRLTLFLGALTNSDSRRERLRSLLKNCEEYLGHFNVGAEVRHLKLRSHAQFDPNSRVESAALEPVLAQFQSLSSLDVDCVSLHAALAVTPLSNLSKLTQIVLEAICDGTMVEAAAVRVFASLQSVRSVHLKAIAPVFLPSSAVVFRALSTLQSLDTVESLVLPGVDFHECRMLRLASNLTSLTLLGDWHPATQTLPCSWWPRLVELDLSRYGPSESFWRALDPAVPAPSLRRLVCTGRDLVLLGQMSCLQTLEVSSAGTYVLDVISRSLPSMPALQRLHLTQWLHEDTLRTTVASILRLHGIRALELSSPRSVQVVELAPRLASLTELEWLRCNMLAPSTIELLAPLRCLTYLDFHNSELSLGHLRAVCQSMPRLQRIRSPYALRDVADNGEDLSNAALRRYFRGEPIYGDS
jgi:hypothetical protein